MTDMPHDAGRLPHADQHRAAMLPPSVVLEQVVYEYREAGCAHRVLDGLSGTICPGEWVALLGESGSGKSTLLHLIAGLDRPAGGRVVVHDVDLSRLTERDRTLFRRTRIGFVYQSFNLLPTLSVIENVALVAELGGARPAVANRAALALLADVGLDAVASRFPDRLSGGQQQRVAIARALIGDPDVVLADEPTGNLDSASGRQVLDLLQRTLRARGKTLIIATHSREVAERADRTWRLSDGVLTVE